MTNWGPFATLLGIGFVIFLYWMQARRRNFQCRNCNRPVTLTQAYARLGVARCPHCNARNPFGNSLIWIFVGAVVGLYLLLGFLIALHGP
jgi:hypothetical protein